MSHSGYGAAQAWARLHGFTFVPPMITDAHDNSLLAVVNGAADIACIDAQTWWMQKQDMVETTQVRVIGWTDPSPGQTFIARLGEDTAIYFAAIEAAIADLPTNVTATLGLRGIVKLPEVDYDLPCHRFLPRLAHNARSSRIKALHYPKECVLMCDETTKSGSS